VNDPNGDQLEFRISLVPDKGNPILLEKAWRERFFTLDAMPVPDGRYRLEVVASDAPSRPFNQTLTGTWRTAAFTIDHTPPALSELTAAPEGDSIRVKFTARDDMSVLKEAALSADGDSWLQIVPDDQVFDSTEEHFDILVPKDRIKGDRITVRVMDASNNEQAAAITVGETKKH
jgi:hypothetical protein